MKDGQGREFTLISAIDAEDQVNIGGRSVTLEKRYRFGVYRVNADDFSTRLAAARASNDPMFRDTEEGLRSPEAAGERAGASNRATSKVIKAALGGVLYDGGRSYPVPLAGVSWVDFDFRKTGTQLSAFFAGPLFVANLSRQVNKSFRWGVDVSLSALPNTFAEYEGDEELTDRRIRNFQQFVGGLLNWQVTSALAVSTQFDLYHDLYQATDETDPTYRVPASGITLANYGEAKYARKGFSAMAAVEHGTRVGWREYGYPDEPDRAGPRQLDALLHRGEPAPVRGQADPRRHLRRLFRRAQPRPVLALHAVVLRAAGHQRPAERRRSRTTRSRRSAGTTGSTCWISPSSRGPTRTPGRATRARATT